MTVMAQPNVFHNFITKRNPEARSIGFLARMLVTYPLSTKGTRIVSQEPQRWDNVKTFQICTWNKLLHDKNEIDEGRTTRHLMKFSKSACLAWIDIKNRIENDVYPGGYLSDIDDAAIKMANNIARLAAVFHYFEGNTGEISIETLNSARDVGYFYIEEFKRLFSKRPDMPLFVSDAIDLEQSLLRWTQNHPGYEMIQKCIISQFGPVQLRRNFARREMAIDELIHQGKLCLKMNDKKQFLVFNPYNFPSAYRNVLQNQSTQFIPQNIAQY